MRFHFFLVGEIRGEVICENENDKSSFELSLPVDVGKNGGKMMQLSSRRTVHLGNFS